MASSRKPGPLGIGGSHDEIRDGTLVLQASPRPGPNQHIPPLAGGPAPAKAKKLKAVQLPVLRLGSRGPDVMKLQRLLNVRLTPGPDLDVDGFFGPATGEAVRDFQRGAGIAEDRVVGKVTWYHLLKGDLIKASPKPTPPKATPTPAAMEPARHAPPGPKEPEIWEWPLRKKLEAAVERVPDRLVGQAFREWEALITPESLVITLLILVGFCLLSGGTAFVLGLALLGADVGLSLAGALITAANASSKEDFDEAADDLAHIVITIGVGAFLNGVNKAAGKVRGGGSTTKPPAPREPTSPKLEGPVVDLKQTAPGKYEYVPEKPVEPSKPTPSKPDPPETAKKETGGDAARVRGDAREQTVADRIGGTVSREKIKSPRGSTDVDVVGPNGELIAVGGPAKVKNLSNVGRSLMVMKEVAEQRGVPAQAYFTKDTPSSVIDLAKKKLGDDNVFTFDE